MTSFSTPQHSLFTPRKARTGLTSTSRTADTTPGRSFFTPRFEERTTITAGRTPAAAALGLPLRRFMTPARMDIPITIQRNGNLAPDAIVRKSDTSQKPLSSDERDGYVGENVAVFKDPSTRSFWSKFFGLGESKKAKSQSRRRRQQAIHEYRSRARIAKRKR